MTIARKKESALLFIGDLLFFLLALWITLWVRYFALPDSTLFYNHLVPFSFLFIIWVLVFFIAGLYNKHTVFFKKKLPGIILRAQTVNVGIAALFFFFIPYFGITPKTNLILYLFISSILILFWRLVLFSNSRFRKKQKAILIGSGKEAVEVVEEVNNNSRYNLEFVLTIDLDQITNPNDLQKEVLELVGLGTVSVIVCDTRSNQLEPLLPLLYNLSFLHMPFRFIDIHKVYEDIFDRIPLSLIRYEWFLENIDSTPKNGYEFIRRFGEIVTALFLGLLTLIVLPFVWIAIKFDDGGPLFIRQERVGKNNQPIMILKFRTMKNDDKGDGVLDSMNEVTRVGTILRKLRLDEFPQIWSVFKGDLSLIGPRPELPALAHYYSEKIPYYNARHLIKPGLSGWAQIYHDNHPHHGSDIMETRVKLSYDIYYLKNRSVLLDLHIGLKTIKTLLSRSGV